MAGWKLRKDKAESETSETEEPLAAVDSASEFIVPPLDTAADADAVPMTQAALAPPTEWGTPEETQGQTAKVVDLGGDEAEPPADYLSEYRQHSEPQPEETEAEEAEPEDHLEFLDEEEPPAPAPALPAPQEPAETEADPDTFSSTMRLDRSELAAALPPAATVPLVAPFILDVPPLAALEVTHRLIVQIGRLSAPFDLTKEVTTIGRPDSALHFYPDVEIELDDAISRRHAEIIRRGDSYSVADAGSTNGTLLNGESLPPHEERLLAHGDRIRLGERTEIIFE